MNNDSEQYDDLSANPANPTPQMDSSNGNSQLPKPKPSIQLSYILLSIVLISLYIGMPLLVAKYAATFGFGLLTLTWAVALTLPMFCIWYQQRAVRNGTHGDNEYVTIMKASSMVASVGFTIAALVILKLQNYGLLLFVFLPVYLGLLASLYVNNAENFRYSRPLLVISFAYGMIGFGILFFNVDGIICMLMAFPLALILSLLGILVGSLIVKWSKRKTLSGTVAVVIPFGLLSVNPQTEAPERKVVTAVEINAAPKQVWDYVIAFPPLEKPDNMLFRAGIAYPTHACITGSGPGAVRECVFSTGPFVEPITVWDEPNLLAFNVTKQPDPMHEINPFGHTDPQHLHGYLNSHRGQFRLTDLGNGKTRLEGTTFYSNRMWPQAYWGLWSDYIIHQIHYRVLNHVKSLSEK